MIEFDGDRDEAIAQLRNALGAGILAAELAVESLTAWIARARDACDTLDGDGMDA